MNSYLYNLQGDVIALVDGMGAKVVEYGYDAWGKPISKTGTMAATLGTVQPFRYRGYVFDEETGDYYCPSRQYRPGWNRFISADLRIVENLFIYCSNNPIINHDRDGLEEEVCYYIKSGRDTFFDLVDEPGGVFIRGARAWIVEEYEESNSVRIITAIYNRKQDKWFWGAAITTRNNLTTDFIEAYFGRRRQYIEHNTPGPLPIVAIQAIDTFFAYLGYERLKVEYFGSYEDYFKTYVKWYQKEKGLKSIDGIVGEKTYESIEFIFTHFIAPYNGELPDDASWHKNYLVSILDY